MATFVLFSVLFLAIAVHSSAMFCICKDGISDQQLQKNIDYACGAGADCTPILQNGPCFNPNTIKDHCNYAVNSYYQRKGGAGASCDFSGTATTSPNPPTTTGSGCVYQSTPGNTGGGPTTPTIAPPGTATPTIAPPGTTTPTIAPPGTTIPTTAPPGTTTPGIGTGGTGTGTGIATTPGTNNPVFGLGPSGSGISNTDGSAAGYLKNSIFLTIALLAICSIC